MTFTPDNIWQRAQRDAILKPFFYDRYYPDRYRFLDSSNPAERYADTLVETPSGTKVVEEKIVHWPTDKQTGEPAAKGHTRFAFETDSSTIEGLESLGWMHTSAAAILIYCFSTPRTEVGLDCYVIDMQALKKWFWDQDITKWPLTRTKEINRSECRLVPIQEVTMNVKTKRYLIGDGWPDSHFCEMCCADAGFGYGVFLNGSGRERWRCREHKLR